MLAMANPCHGCTYQVLLCSSQPLIAAACAPAAVPDTPVAEQGKHHKGERGGGGGGGGGADPNPKP